MPHKTAEATLEASRKIVRANDVVTPQEVTVDLGSESAVLEQEIASNGSV